MAPVVVLDGDCAAGSVMWPARPAGGDEPACAWRAVARSRSRGRERPRPGACDFVAAAAWDVATAVLGLRAAAPGPSQRARRGGRGEPAPRSRTGSRPRRPRSPPPPRAASRRGPRRWRTAPTRRHRAGCRRRRRRPPRRLLAAAPLRRRRRRAPWRARRSGPTVGASAANRRLTPRSSPRKCAAAGAVAHVAPGRAARPHARGRGPAISSSRISEHAVSRASAAWARPILRAHQQRLDGRDRDAERVRHLGVGHPAQLAHQQRRALLLGQPADVDRSAAAATRAARPPRSGRPTARARARAPPAAAARAGAARRCSGCGRPGRATPAARARGRLARSPE